MEQLQTLWKWVASRANREWRPADYPIYYREQLASPEFEPEHGKVPRWTLQVVNWWQMGGSGDTKEEALADFEARFAAFVEAGNVPPRPGRGLPLQFVDTAVVERHEELAREFMREILNLDYDDCFVSDQSSLHDFLSSEEAEEAVSRIERHYRIEVPDPEWLIVSEILEAIATSRAAT